MLLLGVVVSCIAIGVLVRKFLWQRLSSKIGVIGKKGRNSKPDVVSSPDISEKNGGKLSSKKYELSDDTPEADDTPA